MVIDFYDNEGKTVLNYIIHLTRISLSIKSIYFWRYDIVGRNYDNVSKIHDNDENYFAKLSEVAAKLELGRENAKFT